VPLTDAEKASLRQKLEAVGFFDMAVKA